MFKTREEQLRAHKDFYRSLSNDFLNMIDSFRGIIGEGDVLPFLTKNQRSDIKSWQEHVKKNIEDFTRKRSEHLKRYEELLRKSQFKIDSDSELIDLKIKAKSDFKLYVEMFNDFLKFDLRNHVDKDLLRKVEFIADLIFNDYINKNMMFEYIDQFGIPYLLEEIHK